MAKPNKKVVIVLNDSDPVLARVCKNKFKKEAGWDSEITKDYDEAVVMINEKHPDLILTDIIIPNSVKDGVDLVKYVRGMEDTKQAHVPIVMFTDLHQESDKERAFDAGVTDYFIKSELMIQDVIEKIQTMV